MHCNKPHITYLPTYLPPPMLVFQPARPSYPTLDRMMSPTGSTPNLAGFNSLPSHWGSNAHLSTHRDHPGMAQGSLPPSQWGGQYGYPGPPQHPPPSCSMSQLNTSAYASASASQPTLGYIVAYTTDQVAELMKDSFHQQVGWDTFLMSFPFRQTDMP